MPKITQYLSIEFHPVCNLGTAHPQCPNTHAERWLHVSTERTLTDDAIVELATRFYEEFGFRGLVAWHYYNEPLVQACRMFELMRLIRRATKKARFTLWTNGTLLPEDLRLFRRFETIYVTDYGNLNQERVAALLEINRHTTVQRWPLDGRLEMEGPEQIGPCGRMFVEFIADYHGNVRLCCYDWKGLGCGGNVLTDDLGEIVERWQATRKLVCGNEMSQAAPDVCRRCRFRNPAVGWRGDPEIADAAEAEMFRLRQDA